MVQASILQASAEPSIGALMGIAGIEHGVGEMLQGNVAPGGSSQFGLPPAPAFTSSPQLWYITRAGARPRFAILWCASVHTV